MDVLMPDGTLVKDVPEGITKAQLQAKLAGSVAPTSTPITSDVPLVASQMPKQIPIEEPKTSMMDKLKALYEVPATIGSGIVSQPASMIYGLGRGAVQDISQGNMPTAESRDVFYRQARQATQFQPTSPASIGALESIGGALEASKLPPYTGNIGMIPSMQQATQMARPAISQAIQTAKPTVSTMAQALRKEAPTMAGVGAAEVPEAVTRAQIAQQLRVPVELSKGQALRDLGQQKFEIETPKNFPELGKPLIEAQAKRNDAILQNFDAFIDATGKETYGLRETGRVVDKALVNTAKSAKARYQKAYDIAQNSEEGQQPVNVQGIIKQLDDLEAEAVNAPVINSAKIKLNNLSKNGEMTLNQVEEVRKMVNRLSNDSPSNMAFGSDIKKMIDIATENAGGDLFKEARKLRTQYAREFENVGYVDKLLRQKPGTTDRAVAFEDIFDHAILNGSLDDVRSIGMTLKKSGPEGQQAFKELQGQTVQYIKDQVTKNSEMDAFDNPIVSPARFKAVVTTLDQDGKLDYIFGKKGAQEIRDLYQTTMYVNKPLQGAANYSNSASAIITGLDKINQTPLGKIPGLGTVSKFVVEKGKESALKKQIEESIKYTPDGMADALRKTK
jgi:hypothetical protein